MPAGAGAANSEKCPVRLAVPLIPLTKSVRVFTLRAARLGPGRHDLSSGWGGICWPGVSKIAARKRRALCQPDSRRIGLHAAGRFARRLARGPAGFPDQRRRLSPASPMWTPASCIRANAFSATPCSRDACRGLRGGRHALGPCLLRAAFTTARGPDGAGFTEDDPPNFTFRAGPCSFYSGTKALGEEVLAGRPNVISGACGSRSTSVDNPAQLPDQAHAL